MNRRFFAKALIAAPAAAPLVASTAESHASSFDGQSFSAQIWAKAFIEHVNHNPSIATDEGAMIAWFANALMRGHDEGVAREKRALSDRAIKRQTLNGLARAYGSAF